MYGLDDLNRVVVYVFQNHIDTDIHSNPTSYPNTLGRPQNLTYGTQTPSHPITWPFAGLGFIYMAIGSGIEYHRVYENFG